MENKNTYAQQLQSPHEYKRNVKITTNLHKVFLNKIDVIFPRAVPTNATSVPPLRPVYPPEPSYEIHLFTKAFAGKLNKLLHNGKKKDLMQLTAAMQWPECTHFHSIERVCSTVKQMYT